jgi:Skp family chaperone for outer membrane proteins
VKRTWILAGGALALGLLAYAGRPLGAQTGTPAPAPAPAAAPAAAPRIAVVNMAYIITYYNKAKAFKEEMKEASKPYEEKMKGMRAELETLGKEMAKPAAPGQEAQRDAMQKKVKELNRGLEDNETSAKAVLGKKYDDQLKILYLEIYDATRRYARAHDIDVVLQYGDAFTKEDLLHPRRLERVLATTPLYPLYMKEGTDISREVVMTLNGGDSAGASQPAPANNTAGGAAPPAGGGTPGGQ